MDYFGGRTFMLKIKPSSSVREEHTSEESTKNRRLLVVDDEVDILTTLTVLFSPYYTVKAAGSGLEALAIIQGGFVPEVIMADQRMPGMSGTEFLVRSITLVPQSVRVVLTGYTDVQDLTDSINLGQVYRFVTKPWRNDDLLEIIRMCFQHYDLSEEKVALSHALEQLKALNNEKTEILSIVSHDLKNPLNAIMGFGEMIMNGEELGLTKENYAVLGREICNVSGRMSKLINNLLDIQAVESGKIEINLVSVNVASILAASVSEIESLAKAKHIVIVNEAFDADPSHELQMLVDEVFFHQIMENILSNAVKYSPNGKCIWVRSAKHHDKVRIAVQDEGPGISSEEIPLLFQKFTKLSARPTNGEDSTGLGLAIVQKLVHAMNGQVWCESEQGKGATFVLELTGASA